MRLSENKKSTEISMDLLFYLEPPTSVLGFDSLLL